MFSLRHTWYGFSPRLRYFQVYTSARQASDIIKQEPSKAGDTLMDLKAAVPDFAHQTHDFLQQISDLYVLQQRNEFMADVLDVVLALKNYRQDHGAYPRSLEALIPDYLDAIPVDPVAAAPLVYEVNGGGFRFPVGHSMGLRWMYPHPPDDNSLWTARR